MEVVLAALFSNWMQGALVTMASIALVYMATLFTLFGVAELLRRLHDDQKF